jgi:hypothetical protein
MKTLLPSQKPSPDGNRAPLTYGASDSLEHGSFKKEFRSLQGLSMALQQIKLRLTDKTRFVIFWWRCGNAGQFGFGSLVRNRTHGAAFYFSSSG